MRLLACALAAGLCWPVQAVNLASVPADQLLTAPSGVMAQCMARTTTKQDGHEWSFVVPVPADKEDQFGGAGFQGSTCQGNQLSVTDLKKITCDLAKGNDAVQRQTQAKFGIDARTLCATIKVLLPDTAPAQPEAK